MSEIVIRELSPDEFPTILPLIGQLNPAMEPREIERRLTAMLPLNYHCIGAYEEGVLVGVSGFWLGARFWSGEYIDIDNVIVNEAHRSKGIGEMMIAWLEDYGVKRGCKMAMLDCYVTKHAAHKFYMRLGYEILGYHFTKELQG